MKSYRFIRGKLYLIEAHYQKRKRCVVFRGMSHLASLAFYAGVQKLMDSFSANKDKIIYEALVDNRSEVMRKYSCWGYRFIASCCKLFFQDDFLFYPANAVRSSVIDRVIGKPRSYTSIFYRRLLTGSKSRSRAGRQHLEKELVTTDRLVIGEYKAKSDKRERLIEYIRKVLTLGDQQIIKDVEKNISGHLLVIYGAAHFYALDRFLQQAGFLRTTTKWHKVF